MPRFRNRLAIGLVAAAFPITTLLVVIVTASASSSIRAARESVLVETARRVASDVDRFTFERRRDLQQVGAALGSTTRDPLAAADDIPKANELLHRVQTASTAFHVVEIVTRDARVVAAAPDAGAFAPGDRSWFTDTLEGSGTTAPRYRAGDADRWVVTEPLRDQNGIVVGVLAGDIDPRALDAVLAPTTIRRGRLAVIDNDHAVVATRGATSISIPPRIATASLGATEGPIRSGKRVAGVAPARGEGWGVVALQERSALMRPINDVRNTAAAVLAVAFVFFVVFGLLFGRGEEWRVRAIVEARERGRGSGPGE
jgi:hypothetical protein